jgi:hypothetical protein
LPGIKLGIELKRTRDQHPSARAAGPRVTPYTLACTAQVRRYQRAFDRLDQEGLLVAPVRDDAEASTLQSREWEVLLVCPDGPKYLPGSISCQAVMHRIEDAIGEVAKTRAETLQRSRSIRSMLPSKQQSSEAQDEEPGKKTTSN